MRSLPSSRPAFHYLVGPNGYRAVDALPQPIFDTDIPAIVPPFFPGDKSGESVQCLSITSIVEDHRNLTGMKKSAGQEASGTAHEVPFFDLDDGAMEVVPISKRASAALMQSQQRQKRRMDMAQPYAGIVYPYCDR